LAHGLVGLFTILNAIGRYLEAENKIRKATEIFCLLAADSPELFNPECAGALHSTPQVLVDQKRNSEALRVLNEAAAIYAPSPELVTVHQDRRICCTHLKKFSEAVEAARCAIEALKQVETKDDELIAFRRDLAIALYNLSRDCSDQDPLMLASALEAVQRFNILLAYDEKLREKLAAVNNLYPSLGHSPYFSHHRNMHALLD
jgi:tetratricopeptide (TPR) repeat protein